MTVWQEASANQWITAIDTALGETMSQEAAVAPAAYTPGPFSLADPAVITSLLRGAGFADVTVQGLDIPLAFGAVEDAQAFLETWIDDDLDADARARAKASLNDLLVKNATADGVRLRSATWLITGQRPT